MTGNQSLHTNVMKKPILPTEIALRFHPSKFLWGWWLLFSIAVLFSLWLCLSPIWALAGTLLYAAASLWQWTQLVGTHWPFSVQMLAVDVFGQMTLTNRSGQRWNIEVLPDSIVYPGCMVLHITYQELQPDPDTDDNSDATIEQLLWKCLRPTRLLILFDHTDAASQKALRVWLKWGNHLE